MATLTKISILVSCSLLFCAAGCQEKVFHLRQEARMHIESTDVVLGVPQQEINAGIKQSKLALYTGGGLIPALIDASINDARTKEAEGLMSSLRDEMLNYDYSSVFKEELHQSLMQINWLNVNSVIIDREVSDDWIQQHLKNSDASNVLFVHSSYQFTPTLGQIVVTSSAKMIPNTEQLYPYKEKPKKTFNDPTKKGNALYRNDEIIETINLDLKGVEKEDIVAKCADNNASLVKQGLTEAVHNTAVIIAGDMETVNEDK